MAPTVTIILPTYNRPVQLAEAIRSALAQTHQDWVMLVGDNGGDESTESIVRAFDDPRITYLRQPPGIGAQGNWLDLIERAETSVVGSLHDDDTWRPDYLEKALPPLLEDPTLSMVFVDYWVMDAESAIQPQATEELSHRTHRDRIPPGRVGGTYADHVRMIAVWNAPQPAYAALVRRQAVLDTEFPADVDPMYDIWLSFQIACRGEGFHFVPERLTNYRVWSKSLTAAEPIQAEDAMFARILDASVDHPELVAELKGRWADLRYGRAGRLMVDRSGRARSRHELREAEPDLVGNRRIVAKIAGSSDLGWDVVRLGRELSRKAPTSLTEWIRRRNAPDRPERPR